MDITIYRDGLKLQGRLDKPLQEKCPVAILFHGFCGDIGHHPDHVYQKMTDALNENSIAVLRFDFNDHGLYGPNQPLMIEKVVNFLSNRRYRLNPQKSRDTPYPLC